MTRTWLMVAVTLLLGTAWAACGDSDDGITYLPDKPYFQNQPAITLIAHRGGALLYPEHTLYALQQAIEVHQADVLEIDLVLSADGEIFLNHDLTVESTTDGTDHVINLTYAQLKDLDAAYWFDPDEDGSYPERGKGYQMITLDEAWDAIPGAYWSLEIKDGDNEYEEQLHDMVVAYGMEEHIVWGSRNDTPAERLRALDPSIAAYYPIGAVTCFVLAAQDGRDPMTECDTHYDVLVINEGATTPEVVAAAHAGRKAVNVFTINDPAFMEILFGYGVDGIITDRPDILRAVIDAM